MSKKIKEWEFNNIKMLLNAGVSRAVIANVTGRSRDAIRRVASATSWDEFKAELRVFRRAAKDGEPQSETGQITFYGDPLELSRLSGIAAILGIDEFEYRPRP